MPIGRHGARGAPQQPISTQYEGGMDQPANGDWIPFVFWVIGPDLTTIVSPPLYMRVNPSGFSTQMSKVVDSFNTKGAWIEQSWGESLQIFQIESGTGAFVSVEHGLVSAHSFKNESTPLRHKTLSNFQFKRLLDLYRNNGLIRDENGSVYMAGRIRVAFDQGIYDGFFNEFTWTEDASRPYMFTFTISFQVEEIVIQTVYTNGQA